MKLNAPTVRRVLGTLSKTQLEKVKSYAETSTFSHSWYWHGPEGATGMNYKEIDIGDFETKACAAAVAFAVAPSEEPGNFWGAKVDQGLMDAMAHVSEASGGDVGSVNYILEYTELSHGELVYGALFKNNWLSAWLEMQTLGQKLLVPEGTATFLTSDHPVVLLNQLLDGSDSNRCYSGFSRSGFQLVFPLSPFCCLFCYDPKVYKVGGKRETVVKISTEDVDLVNSLQVQSADRCLLFSTRVRGQAITRIVDTFLPFRTPIEEHLKVLPGSAPGEQLLWHVNSTVTVPEPWSFCRLQQRPRLGEDYRRNIGWTQFVGEVVEEHQLRGGAVDLEEIMNAVAAR